MTVVLSVSLLWLIVLALLFLWLRSKGYLHVP